jgi:hypothetical protein
MDEAALHRALSGPEGAPVALTVVRGDAILHATVVRTRARAAGPGASGQAR